MRRIHFSPVLPCDFAEQFQDVLLDGFDIALDFCERARRLIFVEVAVEIDLVTDLAGCLIAGLILV